MSRCDAISRNGSRCKNQAFVGRTKCRMHGGASDGAPVGNQNPIKHGIYAKLFDVDELDSAADMQGSVSTELAIARLQLARLLKKMQQDDDDAPKLDVIEEKTLAVEYNTDSVKSRRAKDAQRFGEYYDAGDDDYPVAQESAPLERKKVFKRRDWGAEFARLTGLIARLEMQLLTMQHKKAEIKAVEQGEEQKGDAGELTGAELDAEICSIVTGFTS